MQDTIDQIIKKLKVIGELTPGKTISTSNSEEWCILDHKSWSSSLWRTYSGEGRESSIYEISKLFKSTISILSKHNTMLLLEHLEKALQGFDTLKETYKDDYNTIASITLISNKTRDSYNWFVEEYKINNVRKIANLGFPESNTSNESNVSITNKVDDWGCYWGEEDSSEEEIPPNKCSVSITNKVDDWGCYWGEEDGSEEGTPPKKRSIPEEFLINTGHLYSRNTGYLDPNGTGYLGAPGLPGSLGPNGKPGTLFPNEVMQCLKCNSVTAPILCTGSTGSIGPTGPLIRKEGLLQNTETSPFTIEPCGKKNSLVCQQTIFSNESSNSLVENTDRSIHYEKDNKDNLIHSKESSDRDSNEHVMLEDKPYYEIKKKVPPYEHISGCNMPNVSFRTWLYKE